MQNDLIMLSISAISLVAGVVGSEFAGQRISVNLRGAANFGADHIGRKAGAEQAPVER
jgi:hypothetical protein